MSFKCLPLSFVKISSNLENSVPFLISPSNNREVKTPASKRFQSLFGRWYQGSSTSFFTIKRGLREEKMERKRFGFEIKMWI